MKAVIVTMATCLTIGLQAQYDDDYVKSDLKDIPEGIAKGDNLILIYTDRSPDANFIEFGKHLVSNGYTFSSKDADFLLLVTDPKGSKYGLHYDYMLNITFNKQLIVIRVKQSGLSVSSSVYHPNLVWSNWYFAKSKSNIMRNSFDDFYPVLKDYGYPLKFMLE